MEHIGDSLVKKRKTVNSRDKSLNTVNSKPISEQIDELLQRHGAEPEYVASELARGLDDEKSLKHFLLLAKEHRPGRLFEALSYTKEAAREGRIKTTKPIYFLAILGRWGLKTKFKEV